MQLRGGATTAGPKYPRYPVQVRVRAMLAVGLLVLGCLPQAARVRADDWSLTRPGRGSADGPRKRGRRAGVRRRRGTASRGPDARAAGVTDPAERARVLTERYLRALSRDPGQVFARERLIALARQASGGLGALAHRLSERSGGAPVDPFVAQLLLGHVEFARGRPQAARAAFEAARTLRPAHVAPLLALADVAAAGGAPAEAVPWLEAALPLVRGPERVALERRLGRNLLGQGDFEAAQGHFDAARRGARGGVQGRAAFARALLEAGEAERAVAAYQAVIHALAGDRRALPSLWLQLAAAQQAARQSDAALASLRRAASLAKGRPGLRAEVREALVSAHREVGTLDVFARELADKGGRDPSQLVLAGRLREELGQPAAAVEAYRRALALRARDEETHLRLVTLLRQQGDPGAVGDALAAAVKAVPGQPRHVLALAEHHMEQGQAAKALRRLAAGTRRFRRQPAFHRAAYALYDRWGEVRLAEGALRALVRAQPHEPANLVALGEHQRRHGDQRGADATFERILRTGGDRAAAHALLGGLYLEQGRGLLALRAFEEAVELQPQVLAYVRGLAEALQRGHRGPEAVAMWARVIELAQDTPPVRREARRQMVAIWHGRGELGGKLDQWARHFGWSPRGDAPEVQQPDLDAGRLLAEAYLLLAQRKRRGKPGGEVAYLRAAEGVLQRLSTLLPDDVETLLALERLRTGRGDPVGAIEVLDRLATVDPASARDYLARMAKHALAVYRDDDAVAYATRVVALSPRDARAHRRLGDLHRGRQDMPAAIEAYARAIELDAALYPVHFDLAELQLAAGEPKRAAELLLRVVASSFDDEQVLRAARSAIQLSLAHGGLEMLEAAWLPLALSRTRRQVFRRILVELYDARARPLLVAAAGQGPDSDVASGALALIGRRAIKPLLEALADTDANQRRIAIGLFAHLDNVHAAAPLLTAAEQPGPIELRRRALLACARVAGPTLLPRLLALAEGEHRRLRDAATWAILRVGGSRAAAALTRLSGSSTPAVRGYAILGMALEGAPTAAELASRMLGRDRSTFVRGAAALSLGVGRVHAAVPGLSHVAESRPGHERLAATVALGLVGDAAATKVLAGVLFSGDAATRDVARAALRRLSHAATGRTEPAPRSSQVPPPGARPDLAAVAHAMAGATRPGRAPLALSAGLRQTVVEAAGLALTGPREHVRAALGGLEVWAHPSLVVALSVPLQQLAAHPEPALRARALRLLLNADAPIASDLLQRALVDPEVRVVAAALQALAARPGPEVAVALWPRLTELARGGRGWAVRRAAVALLAPVARHESTVRAVLCEVAAHDRYAYVREAALSAMVGVAEPEAAKCARSAHRGDTDPRVRTAAGHVLRSSAGGATERPAQAPAN